MQHAIDQLASRHRTLKAELRRRFDLSFAAMTTGRSLERKLVAEGRAAAYAAALRMLGEKVEFQTVGRKHTGKTQGEKRMERKMEREEIAEAVFQERLRVVRERKREVVG